MEPTKKNPPKKGPSKNKKRSSKSKKQPKKNKSLCTQFQETGSCAYGDSCKFAHCPAASPAPPPPTCDGAAEASRDPIDEFFSRYPGFKHRRNAPFLDEFDRLSGKWDRDEQREARKDFKIAMVEQFNTVFGTDENDLASWQRLCRILCVGVPDILKECRQCVQRTHVNLVDLTQSPSTDQKVNKFPTVAALRDYTIRTEKYFPRDAAHAGGLLKTLLRQILNSSPRK